MGREFSNRGNFRDYKRLGSFVFSKLHRFLISHLSAIRISKAHKNEKPPEAAARRSLKISGCTTMCTTL
jgi:hypothetical protein